MSTQGIPVIDLMSNDAATELLVAFQTIGFATLTNHGVDSNIILSAFDQSRKFFELSEEQKQKYKFQSHESNRGYIGMGLEKHGITKKEQPDRKETFDIGNELETKYRNRWPEAELGDTFRKTMLQYFHNFDKLHLRIMKLLAKSLNIPDEDFFVNKSNGCHENLRLLHYHPIHKATDKKPNNYEPTCRGAVHTDFGTITLLTQDSVGGLQVQHIDGSWVFIPPIQGSVIVNVGDMLQRWSNATLRATPHQVVDHPNHVSISEIPERYSIAFFCNANKDVMLECLPQCCSDTNPPRYAPINAEEYLTSRLRAIISNEATVS